MIHALVMTVWESFKNNIEIDTTRCASRFQSDVAKARSQQSPTQEECHDLPQETLKPMKVEAQKKGTITRCSNVLSQTTYNPPTPMALDPPLGWSQNNLAAETSARYRHSAALQSQQSASVARSGSYRYVFKMSSMIFKTHPDATVNEPSWKKVFPSFCTEIVIPLVCCNLLNWTFCWGPCSAASNHARCDFESCIVSALARLVGWPILVLLRTSP